MIIRVVGAGLFGLTAAFHLKRAGYHVEVHEQRDDILQGATSHNQFRLHRGYHYPRSSSTGRQCRAGNVSFMEDYGAAVIKPSNRNQQVYCIAREGSKTGPGGFDNFCRDEGLPARIIEVREPMLNPDMVDMAWSVLESRVDPVKLRAMVEGYLDQLEIPIHFNNLMKQGTPGNECINVYATYRPPVLSDAEYKYQVVEKPVFRLPKIWQDLSVVVMDGPFCCVDSLGSCGLSVMGHVTKSVHWEGKVDPMGPNGPRRWWRKYVNQGIQHLGKSSLWEKMRADAEQYIPYVGKADYQGSLLTVRCVMDHPDDARPTEVTVEGERQLRIFSGKLGTCVDAARDVVRMVRDIENG
jgi:hypothetical protein